MNRFTEAAEAIEHENAEVCMRLATAIKDSTNGELDVVKWPAITDEEWVGASQEARKVMLAGLMGLLCAHGSRPDMPPQDYSSKN